MISASGSGWAGDARVPTCDGRDFLFDQDLEGAEEVPRVSGFDWPSEEAPALFVEALTEGEAAAVATLAREQFVVWLAGGGLHPVPVFYRWVIACCFLNEVLPKKVVSLASGMTLGGAGVTRLEKYVFSGMKPDEDWRRSQELVELALHESGLKGRYRKMEDERSLGDLLDWLSETALEVPPAVWAEGPDWVEHFGDDVREISRASMRLICRWIAGAGDGVLSVLQRFYALVFYRFKVTAHEMTGHDFAALVRQCRATFCEETNRWFEEPGEILLGYRPKSSSGQKSAESSEVFRMNAERNLPRQQLHGRAGLDAEEREAEALELANVGDEARAQASQNAKDWETASAWLSFVGSEKRRKERFGVLTESQRRCVEVLVEREVGESVFD